MAHLKSIKKLVCLQIIPSMGVGGIETGVRDMSSYLNDLNINNYILAENSLNNINLKDNIVLLDGLKFKNILDQKKIRKTILRLIEMYHVNLVHISSRAPAFYLSSWLRKKKISLITSIHNQYSEKNLIKKYYNSFLLKGDAIVANSKYVSDCFNKSYNLKNKEIIVIPRGIDTDYFYSNNITKIKNKKNLIIFNPSRISSWKGHIMLIKFFAKLISEFKINFSLLVISDHKNKYEKLVDQIVKKMNLEQHIIFKEPTTRITELYNIADLVVNSSIRPEGFGRTISESLSMNIPVVAPNNGGTKEQLSIFDKNLLYEINNYNSFKDSISYAIKNYDMIAQKSRSFVLNHYSKNLMCSSLLEIYRKTIK